MPVVNNEISASLLKGFLTDLAMYKRWAKPGKFKWPDLEVNSAVPVSVVLFFIFRHSLKSPPMTALCRACVHTLCTVVDDVITRGRHTTIPTCKLTREKEEVLWLATQSSIVVAPRPSLHPGVMGCGGARPHPARPQAGGLAAVVRAGGRAGRGRQTPEAEGRCGRAPPPPAGGGAATQSDPAGRCSRRDTRGVTIPSYPQAAGRPLSAGSGAFPPPKFGDHCKGC